MSGAVIRAEAHEDLMFASHTQIEGDAEASAWATQRPQHRDAEEAGAETEWKLVARFDSLAERDIALKNGFVTVITQGGEKLSFLADRAKGFCIEVRRCRVTRRGRKRSPRSGQCPGGP